MANLNLGGGYTCDRIIGWGLYVIERFFRCLYGRIGRLCVRTKSEGCQVIEI